MVYSSTSFSFRILRWHQFSVELFKGHMCCEHSSNRDPKVLRLQVLKQEKKFKKKNFFS